MHKFATRACNTISTLIPDKLECVTSIITSASILFAEHRDTGHKAPYARCQGRPYIRPLRQGIGMSRRKKRKKQLAPLHDRIIKDLCSAVKQQSKSSNTPPSLLAVAELLMEALSYSHGHGHLPSFSSLFRLSQSQEAMVASNQQK